MNENKLISVIVPVYNLERTLNRCVQSILSQSYSEFEVILIDDGSCDNSLEICQQYKQIDKRVKVFHHDNHGVSYTRNRGIQISKGDYIIFIDGDDEIEKDMLRSYENHFHMDTDIVIGGIVMITPDSTEKKSPPVGYYSRSELMEIVCKDKSGLFGYVPNKMYRSELLKKNKIMFSEEMAAQEDFDFALSAYAVADSVCCIDYIGYNYYYVGGKREVPAGSLIKNQIKLYSIAERAGYHSEQVIRKIRQMVFVALYFAPNTKVIQEIRKIPDINKYITGKAMCSFEEKIVISLFYTKQDVLLIFYFRLRNCVKKIKKVVRR